MLRGVCPRVETGLLGPRAFRGLGYATALGVAIACWGPAARADMPEADRARTSGLLTLSDATRLFRERGFDLLLAEVSVQQAQADRRAAAALPNPVLSGGIGRSFGYPSSCAGCSDTYYTASVSDQAAIADLFVGKRRLRRDAAQAALDAARAGKVDAERVLLFQVKQLYAQVVLSTLAVDFARLTRDNAQRTLDLVRVREHAGALSDADVARAETAELAAEQLVDVARQALVVARAQLGFLLGMRRGPPSFEIDVSALKFQVPPGLDGQSAPALERLAWENRPDLRAVRLQAQRAQLNTALAQRQVFPDIALSLQYSQEGRGQNAIQPPTWVAGVTLPLPLLYQNQGEIARSRADQRGFEIQRARTEASISADISATLSAFELARARVQRMDGSLLAASHRARDLVQIQYEKGAASLLELLDAQRTYMATYSDYLDTLGDFWIAVFQLEQAVGVEFRR